MAKRMLIDATHPEETRVVVLSGNRLDEYDFETSTKKQLKGNIYLAKVTRVEPSLQACFVEFGGGRHGFLAFNEIHPDYWQIPVADREAMMAEERRLAEREEREDRDERPAPRGRRGERRSEDELPPFDAAPPDAPPVDASAEPPADAPSVAPPALAPEGAIAPQPSADEPPPAQPLAFEPPRLTDPAPVEPPAPAPPAEISGPFASAPDATGAEPPAPEASVTDAFAAPAAGENADTAPPPVTPESIGGDELEEQEEEQEERRRRFKPLRHYKIQEVIKRRQVLLVQVVKEERGTKGAALTTYLSLAGRYCVLMPNTTRGGGISRRITSAQDRKRLKEIMRALDVPEGMAVILRTAGMERSIEEIRRDYANLARLWDDVRELTFSSMAPTLVYEEGSLIKRAMRDLYSRDIDEILVEGREGYEAAKAFLDMLMPGHAEKIRLYDDPAAPLFQRFQVEAQLEEMHESTVRLRSGGYIVINPTEALVAIDVNSGRATRERDIEGTALRTNMEAAEEIARQLRLRDLAGLIVIDFIDMEEHRHAAQVERRLKEAMHIDRARIQIGRISAFGLLELSRQRLRPSLIEVSTQKCPTCGGTGHVRSTESSALSVLRALEEEGAKQRAVDLRVAVPESVALYILNHKRAALASIEGRHGLHIAFDGDAAMTPPAFKIERVRARERADTGPAPVRADDAGPAAFPPPADEAADAGAEAAPSGAEAFVPPGAPAPAAFRGGEESDDDRRGGRRRRRRRRGRGRDEAGAPGIGPQAASRAPAGEPPMPGDAPQPDADFAAAAPAAPHPAPGPRPERGEGDGEGRGRRRGRRGGRRRRGREGGPDQPTAAPPPGAPEPDFAPRPDAGFAPSPGPGYTPPGPGYAPSPEAGFAPPPATADDDLRARARALYAEAGRPGFAAPEAPAWSAPSPAPSPAPTPPAAADSHDWPWNRPAASPAAAAPTPAPEQVPPPAPRAVEPPPAPRAMEPPPAPAAEPQPDGPQGGPPRKGWWSRLTS